jgi:hypothetical protein
LNKNIGRFKDKRANNKMSDFDTLPQKIRIYIEINIFPYSNRN